MLSCEMWGMWIVFWCKYVPTWKKRANIKGSYVGHFWLVCKIDVEIYKKSVFIYKVKRLSGIINDIKTFISEIQQRNTHPYLK